MTRTTQEIVKQIGDLNDSAKIKDDSLIVFNECGYNCTTIPIDLLKELIDSIGGK